MYDKNKIIYYNMIRNTNFRCVACGSNVMIVYYLFMVKKKKCYVFIIDTPTFTAFGKF